MGAGQSIVITNTAADVFGLSGNSDKNHKTKNCILSSKLVNHNEIAESENGTEVKQNEKRNTKGHLWMFPVIGTLLLPLTCFLTYGISVHLDHVEAFFPFPSISMTGTKPPESCIFGLCLNAFSLLGGATVYIRYKQLSLCRIESHCRCYGAFNKVTFAVGSLSIIGVVIVAHFQLDNAPFVHYVGSFLVVVLGMLYFLLQTIISFLSRGLPGSSMRINVLRVIISALHIILLVVYFVFWFMYPDPLMYSIANITEWILMFLIAGYSLTFIKEFQRLRIHVDYMFRVPTDRTCLLHNETSYIGSKVQSQNTETSTENVSNCTSNTEICHL